MTPLRFREAKTGESREVAFYRGADLLAVVTHPCPGAPWHVHFADNRPKGKFRTRRRAEEAATGALLDKRHRFAREFCGQPTARRVFRFCGEWVGHFDTLEEARGFAFAWEAARQAKMLTEAEV
jgi:hypothetical protein